MTRRPLHLAAALAGFVLAATAPAQINQTPRQLGGVDVVERLGQPADLSVRLTDSAGRETTLGAQMASGRPAILVLGYYDCPLVCPLIVDKLLERLNALEFTVGKDYNVVVVSFDPDNTTAMAASYASTYHAAYRPGQTTPTLAEGWTFHTAAADQSLALAESVGYKFNYLPESGEYAHPVALAVLTPEGVISRYIYGFGYPAQDVRLALLEASEGKIAQGVMDRLLLFCFHWDPTRGSYSLAAFRVMQLGAAGTTLGVGTLVAGLWFFDRRRRRDPRTGGAHGHVPAGVMLTGHSA